MECHIYIYIYIYIYISRAIEDYAVVYFGSAIFKIARLAIVGTITVHICACVFYSVKKTYAVSQDDVVQFYDARGISQGVRWPTPCTPRTLNPA
jgi:hypothetical protein